MICIIGTVAFQNFLARLLSWFNHGPLLGRSWLVLSTPLSPSLMGHHQSLSVSSLCNHSSQLCDVGCPSYISSISHLPRFTLGEGLFITRSLAPFSLVPNLVMNRGNNPCPESIRRRGKKSLKPAGDRRHGLVIFNLPFAAFYQLDVRSILWDKRLQFGRNYC